MRYRPRVTIYDCMDELSAFQGASAELNEAGSRTARQSRSCLYRGNEPLRGEARAAPQRARVPERGRCRAFRAGPEPISGPAGPGGHSAPRIGFFGVIDERLDRDLVAEVARQRPDWQLILVGPVVKIDPESLPRAPNIHYLGGKKYDDLPRYIANWDAAMMPFARNEATRFISPTKTPEYLAAGRPLVSTPIIDVVRGWGHLEAVRIAATPAQFVNEAAFALSLSDRASSRTGWLQAADRELEQISWDRTWARMTELIAETLRRKKPGRRLWRRIPQHR